MLAVTARKGDETIFKEDDFIETGDDGGGAKTKMIQKTRLLRMCNLIQTCLPSISLSFTTRGKGKSVRTYCACNNIEFKHCPPNGYIPTEVLLQRRDGDFVDRIRGMTRSSICCRDEKAFCDGTRHDTNR